MDIAGLHRMAEYKEPTDMVFTFAIKDDPKNVFAIRADGQLNWGEPNLRGYAPASIYPIKSSEYGLGVIGNVLFDGEVDALTVSANQAGNRARLIGFSPRGTIPSGHHEPGDFFITSTGVIGVCITAGNPGVFNMSNSGGGLPL